MSIQIGTTNLVTQLNPTDLTGRIVINSATTSNLISLTSLTARTVIDINNFQVMRDNNEFRLTHDNSPFILGNKSYFVITPPTTTSNLTCSGILYCSSNVQVDGTTIAQVVSVNSNLTVSANNPTTSLFEVYRNGVNVLAVNSIGNMSVTNNITANANVAVARTISASNVATSIIQSPTIFMKGNTVCQGSAQVAGDLDVRGIFKYSGRLELSSNLNLDTLNIFTNLTSTQVSVSTATSPALTVEYNGSLNAACNVVSYTIRPQDNNITGFVLDPRGRVGIGSRSPTCLVDIQRNNYLTDPLLMRVGPNIVVNANSYVGIGTNNPTNQLGLNVAQCDIRNSTIGIYHNGNQQYITATSNNNTVFKVANDGKVSIGATNDQYGLFVSQNFIARIPTIFTDQIIGSTINCSRASLSNVSTVSASNIQVSDALFNNLTSRTFFAENFNVLGLNVTAGLSIVSSSNTQFSGKYFVMSEDDGDLLLNPSTEGKLRVQANSATGISRGIVVNGQDDTSIRVHSVASRPFYELTNANGGSMCISLTSGGNMTLGSTGNLTTSAVEVQPNNIVKFANFSQFNSNGIFLRGADITRTDHIITGKTTFRNSYNEPVLFISNSSSNQRSIGICTVTPQYTLDVQGSIFGRDISTFNSGIVSRSVLIGPPSVISEAMRIDSSTISSGILIRSCGGGDPFRVDTNSCKYVINASGNIGVGTLIAQNPLDVFGNMRICQDGPCLQVTPQTPDTPSSIGFFRNSALSGGTWMLGQCVSGVGGGNLGLGTLTSNVMTWLPNGFVGIGTTAPLHGLHVASDRNGFFGSNVYIGNIAYASQFLQTSDKNVKIDLQAISNPLQRVNMLNGYTYFRTDMKRKETGLVAQEVLPVLPEAVDINGNLMSIAYGNMAGLFVEAIKELHEKVKQLEEQVAMLTRTQ